MISTLPVKTMKTNIHGSYTTTNKILLEKHRILASDWNFPMIGVLRLAGGFTIFCIIDEATGAKADPVGFRLALIAWQLNEFQATSEISSCKSKVPISHVQWNIGKAVFSHSLAFSQKRVSTLQHLPLLLSICWYKVTLISVISDNFRCANNLPVFVTWSALSWLHHPSATQQTTCTTYRPCHSWWGVRNTNSVNLQDRNNCVFLQ